MLPHSFVFNWPLQCQLLNLDLVWFCTSQQTPSVMARLKSELSSGHHQSPLSLGSWQTSLLAFLVLLPPLPDLSDSLFFPSSFLEWQSSGEVWSWAVAAKELAAFETKMSQLLLWEHGALRRCCSRSGSAWMLWPPSRDQSFVEPHKTSLFFTAFLHYIKLSLPILEVLPSSCLPHCSPALSGG